MHRGVLVLGLLALAIAACGRSSPAPAPAPQKLAVEAAGPEETRGASMPGMLPTLRPVATSTKFGGGLPQPMPEPAPGGPGIPMTEAGLKEKYDHAPGE